MIERVKAWFTAHPSRLPWVWALTLLLVALWPRVFSLDSMLNGDAIVYWSKRIPQFWEGLASGEYEKTFQTHPGVTLMWASGFFQKLAGVLDVAPSEEFIIPAKLPIALFASLLVVANYALLRRLLSPEGEALAILSSLAMATEPFVVFHSRTLHVDTFFAGFAWLAVLFGLLAIRERKYSWALACGVSLGLGLLSRAVCITICVGLGSWFVFEIARRRDQRKRLIVLLVLVVISTAVTAVLLWPALLHDPIETFRKLVSRTSDMVSRGHRLFFMGKVHSRDPGAAYYLVLLALRTSPEMMLGLIGGAFGLVGIVRKPEWRPLLGLFVSYALLLLILMTSAKKGGRYMLALYPPLIVLSTCGFLGVFDLLRAKFSDARFVQFSLSFAFLLLVLRGARLLAIHPFPIAWCPEYPGLRCEEVITVSGTQGLREVALYLREHHEGGERAKVYRTAYVSSLRPWYQPRMVRKPKQAEYFLSFLTERQRNWGVAPMMPYIQGRDPVLTVEINGVRYAELFLGPAHPDYHP